MNRFLYSALLYLAVPLILLRMLWRSRQVPAYAKRWGERFGFFPRLPADKPVIWVHSVSVGETIASAPMVKELLQQYSNHQLLITTMTPTGSDRVRHLYADELGSRIHHIYCPYDLPGAQRRFLNRVRPELALMVDTELWPNTLSACSQRNIPVIVVNARLSERSYRGYARFSRLVIPMMNCITRVACQNKDDGERFLKLGLPSERLVVTGSVKFDLSVSADILEQGKTLKAFWEEGAGQPLKVFIAASTHDGEDQAILDAFRTVKAKHPDTLLVLVPRHPERFETVYQLIKDNQFSVVRLSTREALTPDTSVVLGDTMGELMTLFAASDIAFVGGSLVETGGHNMLEPAVLGLPVLSGPHVFNFQDISDSLVKAGGLRLVESSEALANNLSELIANEQTCQSMGQQASDFVTANRGALNKTLDLIHNQLPVPK